MHSNECLGHEVAHIGCIATNPYTVIPARCGSYYKLLILLS